MFRRRPFESTIGGCLTVFPTWKPLLRLRQSWEADLVGKLRGRDSAIRSIHAAWARTGRSGRLCGVKEALHLEDELLWPTDSDDPFNVGASVRELIACLNFGRGERWYRIAEGFKQIADLAVARIEETETEQDFLVYPIVYRYRHYQELMLKQLIRDVRRLLGEDGGVPGTHSLDALWNITESLLKRIPDSPDTYHKVRGSLGRFNELDPRSDAFRYPVDK